MALDIIIDSVNDTTFYSSIRRLLGGVDEYTVPNEVILDPAFFDMSEIELIGLVPCLELGGLSAADKVKARLAMIYLIASKLIPTVQAQSEYEVKTIDVTWRKSPVKWLELQNNLMDQVDSLLNGIDCYGGSGDSNIFAVAPSKRAVNNY